MQFLTLILVIIFAVAGPRVLGLVDASSTVGQAAIWGAVFGAAGGFVGGIIQKLLKRG
ncbi:MAG: hypothetical protein JW928_04330 [Candidatus Aureabacteria bacterium]|nr:hypothetical protein [Candidatus Auribacterota bacterium]